MSDTRISVHHTISLGCNCHTSYLLKILGLKKYSAPFDWLGCSIEDVTNILDSNFESFIDPTLLKDHDDGSPNRCGHALYGGRFFHHFNPRIQAHRDYYERCVERFKVVNQFNSQQHVLYIHQAFYEKPTAEIIARLHALLQRYRGSNDFTLLFVYYSKSDHETSFKVSPFVEHTNNVILVDATMLKNINGVTFTHPDDFHGMCNFLSSLFDFTSINPAPFNVSDIREEKDNIYDLRLP